VRSFRRGSRHQFRQASRCSDNASIATNCEVVIPGFVGIEGIVAIPARSVCTIGHPNLIVKTESRLASEFR
jgi:hypothetical protein